MVTIRKMGKKLRKILTTGAIALASLFPMKNAYSQTQGREINQPTPLSKVGNLFKRPYINYDVGKDSTDFYESKGVDWDTLKTKQERISLLEKVLPVEYQLRKTQTYDGFEEIQSFINLHGISNISGFIQREKDLDKKTYDSTSNASFNLPATIDNSFDKNGTFKKGVIGFLVGENPLRIEDWYFFDPTDSNKAVDLSNSTFVSTNSISYLNDSSKGDYFNFNSDLTKWGLENGTQKDTIWVQPFVWRNSPNTTTLSVSAPDTLIKYEKNLDLLNMDTGVKSLTNLVLGKDFDFQGKNEYSQNKISGEVYIRETPSLEDTTYIDGNKNHFKIKKKTLVELIEKNTLSNPVYTIPYEHILKRDSVSQNIEVDKTTPIETSQNSLPKTFKVYQNYPNPFNPSTTIRYELSNYTANFKVDVYDIKGSLVRTLKGDKDAGVHDLKWDGRNEYNQKVGSGVYFYRVTAGDKVESKKMILLK